jgi:hypothetical protein
MVHGTWRAEKMSLEFTILADHVTMSYFHLNPAPCALRRAPNLFLRKFYD